MFRHFNPAALAAACLLSPTLGATAPTLRPATSEVAAANAAARVQPSGMGYLNATQVYPWSDGALYQVYAAPGEVTDIALEPGEILAGTGPVAAGDTVRWVIGDTESGAGPSRTVHILVKPTKADLRTNLVINTDRRTYHLELRSTPWTYMASVSWRYPLAQLIAVKQAAPSAAGGPGAGAASAPAAPLGPDLDHLNFHYRISGPKPPWRPLQVFDDGRQTFVAFPPSIAQGEMPPLYVIGADGKSAELVNYRVQGQHLVVDRVFQIAELRMGDQKTEQRVRIERER